MVDSKNQFGKYSLKSLAGFNREESGRDGAGKIKNWRHINQKIFPRVTCAGTSFNLNRKDLSEKLT